MMSRMGIPSVVVVAVVKAASTRLVALDAFLPRAAAVFECALPALLVRGLAVHRSTAWGPTTKGGGEGTHEAAGSASLGTRRSLSFRVRQVHDEAPAPQVCGAERLGCRFCGVRACHGHEPEAALAAVGVHRQVHAHNAVSDCTVDQPLHLLDGCVVGPLSHVQASVGGLLWSARPA